MGRRRGFLPPAHCQHCGKAPELGQTLWPGDQWRCVICLEGHLPGKDATSKSMHQSLEYARELQEGLDLEAKGLKAEGPRNRAEWARLMAAEIKKQGMVRTTNMVHANGEAVPPSSEKGLHDALTIPDLAAVEASLERSRLLLQTDVAALALDAASTIQASNSLEKMLAHQLAAVHKQAMEQMGRVSYERTAADQAKRLNAAARCMAVYQQGLLTLHKLRYKGQQHIQVQYVQVSQGSQAVIGNVQSGWGGGVENRKE